LRSTQDVIAGSATAAQAFDRTAERVKQTEETIGRSQAAFGTTADSNLKYNEQVNFAIAAAGKGREQLEKNAAEQIAKQKAGADAITGAQGNMVKTQQEIQEKLENDVVKGIPAAQANMANLANATDTLADGFTHLSDALNGILGFFGGKKDPAVAKAKEEAAQKAVDMPSASTPEETAAPELAPPPAPAPAPAPAPPKPAPAPAPAPPKPAPPPPPPKPAAPAAPATPAPPAAPAAPSAAAPAAPKQKSAGGKDGGAEKTGSNNMSAPKPAALKTGSKGGGSMSDADIKKMIIGHEGKRHEPYKDSLGLWTVGIGHLIGDGKTLPPEWNRKFSEEEVMAMFEKDYEKHKKQAESNVPGFSKYDSMGQGALIDLTFNMGPGWPKKFPNTSAKLGAGDKEGAAAGLTDSKWYGQVGGRAPTIVGMIRNSEVMAEEGGEFSGPDSGYPATLHGREAVIPLDNGSGNFVQLFEQMAMMMGQQASSLDELVRIAKNGNDISNKILRQQA
jgi:GH24 family phage-related lysozyme (muramidase)